MVSKISILSSFILAVVYSVPQWEDLQCEDGHKYLFSEVRRNPQYFPQLIFP